MKVALGTLSVVALALLGPGCVSDFEQDPPQQDGAELKLDVLCGLEDSDRDTIPDCVEGRSDSDKDGITNDRDKDSDGDGYDDKTEAGDADPKTAPVDSDKDWIPDYLDADSDNDGLTDAEEKKRGTSRTSKDTDGDGLPDLAEVAAGTDPKDAKSKLNADEFFVILTYNAKNHEYRDLEFGSKVQRADVYFLMDTSTTMNGEISNIKSGLSSTIVPGIAAEIADVAMGVGHFEDMPVYPYGTASFHAYENLQSITTDQAKVTTAIGMLTTCCSPDGATQPESQVPALYSTITGQGLGSYIPAAAACATTYFGYPCFRPQALPIIILITDAMFHNGPAGTNAYSSSISPAAPTYAQAVAELNKQNAKVLGVFSGSSAEMTDTSAIVKDTGAVDVNGKSLVFAISSDGSGLGQSVVQAVKTLASAVARDVDTTQEEYPAVNDGIDAAKFIKAVTPKSASPTTGVKGSDSTTFFKVVPGTKLTFKVDFYNDFVKGASTDKAYQARIVVRGDKSVLLDWRRVVVIVPRQGSTIVVE